MTLQRSTNQGLYQITIPEITIHTANFTTYFVVKSVILIQPTISFELPVPSQCHYGFHSFPVVD